MSELRIAIVGQGRQDRTLVKTILSEALRNSEEMNLLQAYLDTGLTPEKICSMIAELNTMQKAYEKLTEKNERLQKECADIYTQLMETEKDAQEIIAELRNEHAETKADRDYWKAEAIKATAELGEMKITGSVADDESNRLCNAVIEWRNAYMKMKEQWKHDCDLLVKCGEALYDYRKAEEQGLLHKAPVPDGTTIYYPNVDDCFGEFGELMETSYLHGYTEYALGEMGTGWFVTKEAAENYLKGGATE